MFNIKTGEKLTHLFLKSDVLLPACVCKKFIKVSFNEVGINPLYGVSLPSYTWQCDLKYTAINLQTLQDKDWILTFENIIRVGISSIMGDRYVEPDENNKRFYIDATKLYEHLMSQPLPSDEIEMWHFHPDVYLNNLEEFFNTSDDSDFGFFLEVDLRYPNKIKGKTKKFPFCPENKVNYKDKYKDYVKKNKA